MSVFLKQEVLTKICRPLCLALNKSTQYLWSSLEFPIIRKAHETANRIWSAFSVSFAVTLVPRPTISLGRRKWKPKTSIFFVGIFWFLHTVYLFTEPAVWLKGLVVLYNMDTCVVMNHGNKCVATKFQTKRNRLHLFNSGNCCRFSSRFIFFCANF